MSLKKLWVKRKVDKLNYNINMPERSERPSFIQNFLRPISYARELREKGVQKRDLPLLGIIGVGETLLVLLALGNDNGLLMNVGLIAGANLSVHTLISLAASDAVPPGGFVGG